MPHDDGPEIMQAMKKVKWYGKSSKNGVVDQHYELVIFTYNLLGNPFLKTITRCFSSGIFARLSEVPRIDCN
jgi:hypothetical protein